MRKIHYLMLVTIIAVILVGAGCGSTGVPGGGADKGPTIDPGAPEGDPDNGPAIDPGVPEGEADNGPAIDPGVPEGEADNGPAIDPGAPEGDPDNGPAIDPPEGDPEGEPDTQDSDEPPTPDLTATFEALAPPLPPDGWWELKHHKLVLNCTGEEGDINSPVFRISVDSSETTGIKSVHVFDGTGYVHSEVDDNIPPQEMRLESFTDEVYSVVLYDDEAGESIDFYIQSLDAFPFGFGYTGAIEISGVMRLDYYLQYSADEPNTMNGLIISFVDNCVAHRPITLEYLGPFD